MPNWTYNMLTVKAGTPEEIDDFVSYARTFTIEPRSAFTMDTSGPSYETEVLDFDRFVPIPEMLKRTPHLPPETDPNHAAIRAMIEGNRRQHGAGTAYEWHCDKWGTKWGACHTEMQEPWTDSAGNRLVEYTFDTAWAPPVPVIEAMSKMFPKLHITLSCHEECNCFKPFTATFEAGEQTSYEEHEQEEG